MIAIFLCVRHFVKDGDGIIGDVIDTGTVYGIGVIEQKGEEGLNHGNSEKEPLTNEEVVEKKPCGIEGAKVRKSVRKTVKKGK